MLFIPSKASVLKYSIEDILLGESNLGSRLFERSIFMLHISAISDVVIKPLGSSFHSSHISSVDLIWYVFASNLNLFGSFIFEFVWRHVRISWEVESV